MEQIASNVIRICGGVRAVSSLVNRDETQVRRWMYPKSRRGTGGLIPTHVQQDLIDAARAQGIDLRPEHFFREVADLAHQPEPAE